jgi:hypothetical protein
MTMFNHGQTMVTEKQCHGRKMNCYENVCIYEDKIPKTPNSDMMIPTYKCEFKIRHLRASSSTNQVIHNSFKQCYPNDYQCVLPSSIIIWNSTIINECRFKVLDEINDISIDNNFYYSNTKKIAFLGKTIKSICNIDIIETTLGLFLVDPIQKNLMSNNFINVELDDRDMRQLMLAEIDYHMLKMKEILTLQKNEIKKQMCDAYYENINIILKLLPTLFKPAEFLQSSCMSRKIIYT